ncbi:hypothetical protein CVU83_00440 [Candidatus Falkowbacteria bacterium HGW-Falkowbacteria-2]|uniref:Uncharacterized protein n=1 Tax=Candidatus Falkowbacteria bacterium HGW-Falkowbacteria-2 TaxID=2013769 RepID=A0A2N2E3J5_9BACT|nr:MAG: hypothetical protein CVU83_00440 [Candidatus Falkowbacteria bacterium HGW-Falkowbacteria-2]
MRKIIKYSLPLLITAFLIVPGLVLAQTTTPGTTNYLENISGPANAMQSTAQMGTASLSYMISTVIKVILSILGIIFLVLMVFTGYRWMTASGNEEAVTKAKHTLKTSIIGLLIILAAYAITAFVFRELPMTGGSSNAATGNVPPEE